jgi:hypothetical protein
MVTTGSWPRRARQFRVAAAVKAAASDFEGSIPVNADSAKSLFDVRPFDVNPFDVSPFDVSPFDVNPFDVNPFDVRPFDVRPARALPDVTPSKRAQDARARAVIRIDLMMISFRRA